MPWWKVVYRGLSVLIYFWGTRRWISMTNSMSVWQELLAFFQINMWSMSEAIIEWSYWSFRWYHWHVHQIATLMGVLWSNHLYLFWLTLLQLYMRCVWGSSARRSFIISWWLVTPPLAKEVLVKAFQGEVNWNWSWTSNDPLRPIPF